MRRWLANLLGRWSYELGRSPSHREQARQSEHELAICQAQRDCASRELASLRREVSPVEPPALAPDWLPEHRNAWRAFLGSPAGQTLRLRGRAIQFHTATKACQDVFHTQHSAGAAKGFGECLDWLDSLSRASTRTTDDSEPEKEGQTDATPTGETALREALSP